MFASSSWARRRSCPDNDTGFRHHEARAGRMGCARDCDRYYHLRSWFSGSQGMLTAPRVYYAMSQDGLFFQGVGRLHSTTRVPVVAIGLQGVFAIVIALSGRYDQILNYVVSVDFIFFGLTACCIFVFRRHSQTGQNQGNNGVSVPGHPITTILFIAACWIVVINTIYNFPRNTLIGVGILLAGIPVYLFWRWRNDRD